MEPARQKDINDVLSFQLHVDIDIKDGGGINFFGAELILDILELQMKSKKNSKAYISVILKLILDILVIGADCFFKLLKGEDLKKEFGKP